MAKSLTQYFDLFQLAPSKSLTNSSLPTCHVNAESSMPSNIDDVYDALENGGLLFPSPLHYCEDRTIATKTSLPHAFSLSESNLNVMQVESFSDGETRNRARNQSIHM